MKFPEHSTIQICHNWHKINDDTVEHHLNWVDHCVSKRKDQLLSFECVDYKACCEKDEVWEVKLFPDKDDKYHYRIASRLDDALQSFPCE